MRTISLAWTQVILYLHPGGRTEAGLLQELVVTRNATDVEVTVNGGPAVGMTASATSAAWTSSLDEHSHPQTPLLLLDIGSKHHIVLY